MKVFGAKLKKIKINYFGKIYYIYVYDCSFSRKKPKQKDSK